MSLQEIKNLISEAIDQTSDINNIPKNIPINEKALHLEARILACDILKGILSLAEGEKRSEKDKFYFLPK